MTYLINLPLDLKKLLLNYLFNHDFIEACTVLNHTDVNNFIMRDFSENFHQITHPLGQKLLVKYMTPLNLYKFRQEYQDKSKNKAVEKLIENVRSTEDHFDPCFLGGHVRIPEHIMTLVNQASTAFFSSLLTSELTNDEILDLAQQWLDSQRDY